MPELHFPWMEGSILIPLLGAVYVSLLRDSEQARRISIGLCAMSLLCAAGEWIDFTRMDVYEAHDSWDVLRIIFHEDVFVIDELTAPLLPLGALLYLLTVLATLRTKVNRFSFGWTLVSESLLLATFSCRSPWIVIALLTLGTIPPWIELRNRRQSTRVYVIHMGLFIALLCAGQALVPANASPTNTSIVAGGLIAAAVLLRSGVVPLHCWITDLFEKATFGTALLFVTPMTGVYAVMRLLMPIAPDWGLQSIAVFSLATAVYAGGMALIQHESRRFFCYLFLSQSSLVLVGLETVTPVGLTGALCVWISVAISMLGFGLTLRGVEARAGRLSLDSFHGLYNQIPEMAAFFLLTGLASIGFPGTVGFVGAELLVEGAVGLFPLVGMFVVLAAALNGIAVMHAYFRLFTGTVRHESISLRARWPEKIAVLTLSVLILGGGLWPQPGVSTRYHAATEMMSRRNLIPPISSTDTDQSDLPESDNFTTHDALAQEGAAATLSPQIPAK
jgi:NADH-quinone oxidoreductase subunit M